MSGAAGWLKATVAALARIAPGPTARLALALYRNPNVARRFDSGDREMLTVAEGIMAQGDVEWTETPEGRLRAFRFRPKGEPKGLVLLLHGWTADARAMAGFVEPLLAAGWSALIPDMPAHGDSFGKTTDAPHSARAVIAILDGARPDRIIGHSFGGGVMGMLATYGVTAPRAVSIASPSNIASSTDDFCAAFAMPPAAKARFIALVDEASGVPHADLDGLRIWPDQPTEMLILHAPDDAEVDFSEAERLAALPNARLLPLPGLGHRRIVYDETSVSAAIAFIET